MTGKTVVPGGTSLSARIGYVAIPTAATLVFFHRAISGKATFLSRDMLRVYHPLYQYWVERIRSGRFPEWYPYDGLGQPYVGMVISGTFHPLHLIWFFAPAAVAMKISVLLCFPIALCGVFWLARGFSIGPGAAGFAAVAYAFSGYLIGITNNLAYLLAAATIPWVLWAVDRLLEEPTIWRGVRASILLVLVLFSGDLEGFAVTAAICLPLALYRLSGSRTLQKITWMLGVCALAALIGAVQLLPAFDARVEGRSATITLEEAMRWSVHPLRLADLALGPVYASEPGTEASKAINRELLKTGMSTLWVDSLHLGSLVVVFAAVALFTRWRTRGARFLLLCLAIFVALAIGKHSFFYPLAFRFVPFWRSFRYPEKLMLWVSLCMSLAAAIGLQSMERVPRIRRRVVLALLGIGITSLGFGLAEASHGIFSQRVLGAFWPREPAPEAVALLREAFRRALVESGVISCLTSIAISFLRKQTSLGMVVSAACFVLLFLGNERLYHLAQPAIITQPSPLASLIHQAQGGAQIGEYRVYRLTGKYGRSQTTTDVAQRLAEAQAASLEAVIPAMWDLEGANTYLPAVSRRVDDLDDEFGAFASKSGIFNVRYLSVSQPDRSKLPATFKEIGQDSRFQLVLLRNDDALPRAYLAQPHCVGSRQASGLLLSHPQFDPRREVLLECSGPPLAPVDFLGRVSIAQYLPEEVELQVGVVRDAVLVLSDAYYSGWTATVDGNPSEIIPANHCVRAVRVSEGTHRVTFRYQAPGLRLGTAITGLTLLALLASAILKRRAKSLRAWKQPRNRTRCFDLERFGAD